MTPTLKLKRRVVIDHFADEVEALYSTASPGSADSEPDRDDLPAAGAHP